MACQQDKFRQFAAEAEAVILNQFFKSREVKSSIKSWECFPIYLKSSRMSEATTRDHRHKESAAATIGATIKLVLSPTPPVLCLSI